MKVAGKTQEVGARTRGIERHVEAMKTKFEEISKIGARPGRRSSGGLDFYWTGAVHPEQMRRYLAKNPDAKGTIGPVFDALMDHYSHRASGVYPKPWASARKPDFLPLDQISEALDAARLAAIAPKNAEPWAKSLAQLIG